MAKPVRFSLTAQQQRLAILTYWEKKTGNKSYSKYLDSGFRQTRNLISRYPEIGRRFEGQNERYFVFGAYQIIYAIEEAYVIILQVWDTRQGSAEQQVDL